MRHCFVVGIAVSGKGPVSFDAARCAQNMLLAAWDQGVGGSPNGTPDPEALLAEAASLLAEGLTRKDVVRRLTESTGLGRNEVYRLVMELP